MTPGRVIVAFSATVLACRSNDPAIDHLTLLDREPIHRNCRDVITVVSEVLRTATAREAVRDTVVAVDADGLGLQTTWSEESSETGYRWSAKLLPSANGGCVVHVIKESKAAVGLPPFHFPRQAML
jgi:hypothetical protein